MKPILLLAALALPVVASAGTGWTNTVGGAQLFLDPANWDEGDVNGVFPAEWTSSSTATHSIRLTDDWTGTIRFLGSIVKEVTFAGFNASNTRGEPRTITLDGDLVLAPAVSQYTDSRLTFDANVRFDLGGATRTILGNGVLGTKLRFNGAITNGNLVLDGDGAGMALLGAGAVDGDVVLRPNTTLSADYPGGETMVKRAKDVELHRATLSANARNASDTARFGALTVTGADAPGVSFLQVAHNGKLAVLEAQSLAVTNGGTLAVMAADPGAAPDATTGSRILFATAPALRGTGSAGTVAAPVLPGVVAGANATLANIAGQYGANQPVLATYDSTVGVRKLADAETSDAVSAGEAVNLVVPSATTLTLAADATVNSLQLRSGAYNAASPKITGDATLSVRSGMVLATAPKDGAKIDVALDFGPTNGHLVAAGSVNYGVDLTKPVYGSGGLVLAKGLTTAFDTTVAPSSGARGFSISTSADAGTYTGDTWIQSIVSLGSSPFLPHGTRSGNTIVNGCLSFGTISINGLYGSGAVRGTALTVGEDGSDGRFAGTAYLTSALNVGGGRFFLDGSIPQGNVSVAADAAIGGSGGITNNLAFAEGGLFAVEIAGGAAPCLSVAGDITGAPAVSVSATDRVRDDFKACILRSGDPLAATFRCATKGYKLELREGDTELWLIKNPSAMLIVVK
jgi:hypothetical protein